jgi:hypothetical protein
MENPQRPNQDDIERVNALSNAFDEILTQTREANPEASTYDLLSTVAGSLPHFASQENQLAILRVNKEQGSEIAKKEIKAMLYLNLRTIFTVIDDYVELAPDDADDILDTAITASFECSSNLNDSTYISLQVHQRTSQVIRKYFADKINVPEAWITPEHYKALTDLLKKISLQGRGITEEEAFSLIENYPALKDISVGALTSYVAVRSFYPLFPNKDIDIQSDEAETMLDNSEWHVEAPIIKKVFETILSEREQLIITLRFGLNGSAPKALEEIGGLLEQQLSRERVRQIVSRALKMLRRSMPLLRYATEVQNRPTESLIKNRAQKVDEDDEIRWPLIPPPPKTFLDQIDRNKSAFLLPPASKPKPIKSTEKPLVEPVVSEDSQRDHISEIHARLAEMRAVERKILDYIHECEKEE